MLLLSGCSLWTLSESGSRVLVMKSDPPPGCQEVGSVRGGDDEKVILRNMAAEKGGNYVRLETVTPNGILTGTAYKCPESAPSTAAR